MSNYYREHNDLRDRAKLAFQKAFPSGRIFNRDVGLFLTQRGTPINIGIKGQADVYGWVPVLLPIAIENGKIVNSFVAVHFEAECKAGASGLKKEQRAWKDSSESTGVIYILVREENDIVNEIKKKLGL